VILPKWKQRPGHSTTYAMWQHTRWQILNNFDSKTKKPIKNSKVSLEILNTCSVPVLWPGDSEVNFSVFELICHLTNHSKVEAFR